MAGKLIVPGHQPIPDLGARPEGKRKFIKALLQKPLRNLSLNAEGYLIIPTQEEIAKVCPVSLSDEQEKEFAIWRAEFPRDKAAAAVGATEEGGGSAEANSLGVGNKQSIAAGRATPPIAPGTKADSEADLKATFGDEILSQTHLPEGGVAATREITLCLTATQAAVGTQKTWRVWFHNKASQNANVPAGTLIGQGRQGTFVSLVTQEYRGR